MQSASGGESMKEHVVDTVPKRIKEIEFGIQSNQDIVKQAVLEISSRELYVPTEKVRTIAANGPLDGRLGTSRKGVYCDTCGEPLQTCNGHFGYVRLALPVFHIGYFRMIIEMLQDICKSCSRILLTEKECRQYLIRLRVPNLDSLVRDALCKKINLQCKKTSICHYCKAENGVVKKAPGPLKIIHDKYRKYNASTAANKRPPQSLVLFEKSFYHAKKGNPELAKHVKKAVDDLNPLRVLHLFQQITALDCELLGMNPSEGRPEMFIWQYVPAPPVCIRPSVVQDNTSTEDEITSKLGDIVNISSLMRLGIRNGQPVQTLMEQWDYLQISVAMYINSNVPGLMPTAKPIRGFCQRLKGKQGRFRGNLSGKRVDFSGRTVISPDPNLGIDEVAIPVKVAMNLTYPETVTQHNRAKLQSRVRNAIHRWPGANYLTKKGKFKTYLKFGRLEQLADDLEIGDVVERHLEDGDIVLFNRQPSLHKLSILSHYVKVRPWRTFRLNECVCTPYNADFDGDEMNLHVPQTEEARTEAIELMGVKHNLATPKNGEPIIAAIQDFITASYLLTNKDNFFNRRSFTLMCMSMVDGNTRIDLPPPAIYKPEALWTGKQVFNILIRPNKASPVKINLDAPSKQYRPVPGEPRDLDENDGWMIIRNSEIMCGIVDKSAIGAGKKESIFNVILRDFGADEAVSAMNRLSKLSARWLTNQGFSIGIGDVTPGLKLVEKKQNLVRKAYKESEDIIEEYSLGKLKKAAGCDEEQTMENKISGLLSKVRQDTGKTCIEELSRHNSPLIMATSGSKGSEINVAQMVAVVGQQIIGGERVPDGFQDRSLPHFPKNSKQPPSKGFVRNSFFTGLNPTEFLFHAISGREGLVDTAVKTAETGYMSRRLMKSLEDLSTQYDDTVRNSASGVVQFKYGDDKLDPVDMEAKAKPVNFERAFIHAEATTWSNSDAGLSNEEILDLTDQLLGPEEDKLVRVALDGTPMDYRDDSLDAVDQLESGRDFLTSIRAYIESRSQQTLLSRKKHPLPTHPSHLQRIQGNTRRKASSDTQFAAALAKYDQELAAADRIGKISAVTLRAFIATCLHKYNRAQVEPGHAVGAVGAQSIGEPGTQMTLKTFHFAGVAGMSITQGVPRIKEIINASKTISTPVIKCELEPGYCEDIKEARSVKARVEKTYLREIIQYIEEVWGMNDCYISFKIDYDTIAKLRLDVNALTIRQSILAHKKLKIQPEDITIFNSRIQIAIPNHNLPNTRPITSRRLKKAAPTAAPSALYAYMQHLKRTIPNIAVTGAPQATRAILQTSDQTPPTVTLLVEGYGLAECMRTEGVDGLRTTTNSVLETYSVLGIEAARATIAAEISLVMADMDIDPRHMALLADVMTYRGSVLGITRFGLAKMRESVLQLASFEKTPDHLFDAAWRMKRDRVQGVSECIIMGQAMGVGTGAMRIVKDLGFSETEDELGRKRCVFEDAWARRVERGTGVVVGLGA